MTRPRITFLPADAEAHAAIVAGLAKSRDLTGKADTEYRRHGRSERFLTLMQEGSRTAGDVMDMLLAAGMVVDDGEAAEGDT